MKNCLLKFMFALLISFAVIYAVEQNPERRYVRITNPQGTVVRENIESGANMVGPRRIPRGQLLEVLGTEGRLWVMVRTRNGDGFVQIADVEFIESGMSASLAGPITLALILLGAVGAGVYVFTKKKAQSSDIL